MVERSLIKLNKNVRFEHFAQKTFRELPGKAYCISEAGAQKKRRALPTSLILNKMLKIISQTYKPLYCLCQLQLPHNKNLKEVRTHLRFWS